MNELRERQLETQYNIFSNTYDTEVLNGNPESIENYFSVIPKSLKGLKLLDMGCGEGRDLIEFHKRGAAVHGIDASEDMLQLATKNVPNAELNQTTFDNLPYQKNSFDIITSKWAFQSAENIGCIYKEVYRVLRPGGLFIFLVTHPIRHFIEKKQSPTDYFKQELVNSTFFDGKVSISEPSHTFNEFLSPLLLNYFDLRYFNEAIDSGSEVINGHKYPSYALFKAVKHDQ